MLSKKAIEKFKKLYKKRFGEELSDKVALDKATRLVNLYRTVYGHVVGTEDSKRGKKEIK